MAKIRRTLSIRRLLLSLPNRGGKEPPPLLDHNDVLVVERRRRPSPSERQERLSGCCCSTCVGLARLRPECGWMNNAEEALDLGSQPKQSEAPQKIRDAEGNLLCRLWFIASRCGGLVFVMVSADPFAFVTFQPTLVSSARCCISAMFGFRRRLKERAWPAEAARGYTHHSPIVPSPTIVKFRLALALQLAVLSL